MSSARRAPDVIVIGGGPAGLAGAIAARLEGLEVTLIDRRRPLTDKACGEGIMPDGVSVLAALGVLLPEKGSYPFEGIRYMGSGADARGTFGGRPGLGVRRTVLYEALIRRATEIGVRFHWGSTVRRVLPGGVELDDRTLLSRFVVVADGQTSRLRRALGLELPPRHRRFGIRRHYEIEPRTKMVEVFWSTGCEGYVTPVADRLVCMTILTDDKNMRADDGLARFPDLQRYLQGARQVTTDMGSPTLFGTARAVVRGNVALLGDASGSVDAITGAGVTLALHQAVALARALRQDDLTAYAAAHRRIMRLPNLMTSMMLAINSRTWLRALTLNALERVPRLFSGLLALHTRALPLFCNDASAGSIPRQSDAAHACQRTS